MEVRMAHSNMEDKKLKQYLLAEATEYEFKSCLEEKKPKSWLKSVSAFANGIGGSIYFGVSDEGVPVGLEDMQAAITKIAELIKERIEPPLTCDFLPLQVEGVEILRLRVPSGQNTPYYYVGDGQRIAYYRLGNQSVPAPSNILMELTLRGSGQSWDILDSKLNFEDYSFTLFEATYREKTGSRIDKAKDYASFGMVVGDKLTNAGALFADQYAIYQSRIFCTRWNGLTKTSKFDAKDDKEYEGNIIKILGEALSFCKTNSALKWYKTGNGRAEFPDYPQTAIYEALVNALIHREYLHRGTEVHIDIYDDRLEIISPGAMYDGRLIQELDVLTIHSYRRNPVICDIMHRMDFMERRGSGLKKIVEVYPSDKRPEFKSTPQVFIVSLKNLNYGVDDNARMKSRGQNGEETREESDTKLGKKPKTKDLIIQLLAVNKNITAKELAEQIGVTEKAIELNLKKLKDAGIIVRVGSTKAGHWEIIKK